MQKITKWAVALSTAALLGGCGDTVTEQAIFGGGAGAAASHVTKGDLLTGALVGAVGNVAYCQTYPSRC